MLVLPPHLFERVALLAMPPACWRGFMGFAGGVRDRIQPPLLFTLPLLLLLMMLLSRALVVLARVLLLRLGMVVPELLRLLLESCHPHRPSQEATAAVVYRRLCTGERWTRRWSAPPSSMNHQNPHVGG